MRKMFEMKIVGTKDKLGGVNVVYIVSGSRLAPVFALKQCVIAMKDCVNATDGQIKYEIEEALEHYNRRKNN